MSHKKREKLPGPGDYPINRDLGSKPQAKGKQEYHEKITFLDNAEYEGLQTPGVGEYEVKIRSKTEHRNDKSIPDDWIKKHK